MSEQVSQSQISTQCRPTVRLNARLDNSLLAYAVAASAAGVGMLALAQPAEAKIVYTPANLQIPQNSLLPLDLNNDGSPDFQFYNAYSIGGVRHDEGFHAAELTVGPAQNANEIWGVTSHSQLCAAAVRKGRRVGPKKPFQGKTLIMAATAGSYTNGGTAFGPWLKVRQAYLGLKFVIHGKTHFGWARIKMGGNAAGINATLTGYAYETVANRPIVTGKKRGPAETNGMRQLSPQARSTRAPQPASLGRLAQGAAGF